MDVLFLLTLPPVDSELGICDNFSFFETNLERLA